MTDLHTHILPGMDDGAGDVSESLALLHMEWEQDVDTVVLTPHFYRERENPKHFLQRRRKASEELSAALSSLSDEKRDALPQTLLLGAEVTFAPGMAGWDELPDLCIQGTENLLLELPFHPWSIRMIDEIYGVISRTGITPVIAHLERYLSIQRPELINEILALGVPVQVTGDVLSHFPGRRAAMNLLKGRGERLIASDCHSCAKRPPVMKKAFSVLEKKLGAERVSALLLCADRLAGV